MSKEDKEQRIVNRDSGVDDPLRASTEAKVDTLRAEALPPSAEELAALLREEALTNALPNPPSIPGYHLCWLSTTNTYTPIQHYIRLGYVPVKAEEISAWQYLQQHSAQIGDQITCNEMVLYKISTAAYQQIMKAVHHDRPNAEAERMRANIDMLKQDLRDSDGASLVKEEGDGFSEVLDRRVRVGSFE